GDGETAALMLNRAGHNVCLSIG
ncbi:hypothetical protein Q604_UNBC00398G0002, partial [human gut metagenome]